MPQHQDPLQEWYPLYHSALPNRMWTVQGLRNSTSFIPGKDEAILQSAGHVDSFVAFCMSDIVTGDSPLTPLQAYL